MVHAALLRVAMPRQGRVEHALHAQRQHAKHAARILQVKQGVPVMGKQARPLFAIRRLA